MVEQQGIINIVLDNVSESETLRLRENIHTLIANGCLSIRNGYVKINFDSDGIMQELEVNIKKWRRPKQFNNLNSNKERVYTR
jgi:hypothetical protein